MKSIITFVVLLTLFSCQSKPAPAAPKTKRSIIQIPDLWNLHEAIDSAKAVKKPLFVYFTAWAVSGSREMDEIVLADSSISKTLTNDFIMVYLYVDERAPFPPDFDKDKYPLTMDRKIKAIGDFNRNFQLYKTNTITQPVFAIMDSEAETVYDYFSYNPSIPQVDSIISKALQTHRDAFLFNERQ